MHGLSNKTIAVRFISELVYSFVGNLMERLSPCVQLFCNTRMTRIGSDVEVGIFYRSVINQLCFSFGRRSRSSGEFWEFSKDWRCNEFMAWNVRN